MADRLEPFVGPRPFEPEDSGFFFGRDHEASELVSLVMAHATVVLYAQSGAGKTSLLKAKVLTVLKEKKGFDVLPIARVHSSGAARTGGGEASNVYVANALRDLSDNSLAPEQRSRLTFAEYLAQRPYPPLPADDDEDEDEEDAGDRADTQAVVRRPRVIILDQFEELFTQYRERYNDRRGFFEQLRDALAQDTLLRIVFSMREDYIAELDPYVHVMPDALRIRYRMERLRERAALKAVEGPLDRYNREVAAAGNRAPLAFAAGVAVKLVNNLRTVKVYSSEGEVEFQGEFIEPVQLQIVGKALCEKMLTEGHTTITEQDLDKFGNVKQALTEYFERAVSRAASAGEVIEGDLRRWFDRVLITPDNTRSTVLRGNASTAGIPNAAIDVLEAERLIRSETRDNRLWYELSHDKLIEPIRASNQRWLLHQPGDEQLRVRLIARAEEWLASRPRNNSLLLNESEIADAQRWSDPATAGYHESLPHLIEASRSALAEAEVRKQKEETAAARQAAGRLRLLAGGLAVVVALAAATAVYAYRQKTIAFAETQRAEEQADTAARLKTLADTRAAEANVQKLRAQESEIESNHQKVLALESENVAKKLRNDAVRAAVQARNLAAQAEAQRELADSAKGEAERQARLARENERIATEAVENLKKQVELTAQKAQEAEAHATVAREKERSVNEALEDLKKQIALTDEKAQEARENKELVTALRDVAGTATRNPRNGKLKLELVDVYGKPLRARVSVVLRNQLESSANVTLKDHEYSAPITIPNLLTAPKGVYLVEVASDSYLPVARFVNVASKDETELSVILPFDSAKVRVEFPAFSRLPADAQVLLQRSARVLGFEGRTGDALYDSLDDLRKAALLNTIAKARATVLDDGESVLKFIEEIRELRGDRFLAAASDELLDESGDSVKKGLLNQAATLQSPPPGFAPRGSFKTRDQYGTLQLTLFTKGDECLVAIEIDAEGGLGHLFQVNRNSLSGRGSHPYDIHEMLIRKQIDPGYRLLP